MDKLCHCPGEPRLAAPGRSRCLGRCRVGGGLVGAWRRQAQVGVVDQFGGAVAGALGEVAFGQGLQAPGEAFDQPGAVAGAVASPKTSAKRCRSWPTVRRCSAATSLAMFTSTGFSFVGMGKRSTRVDSEPHFVEKLKAIRDKKERFFSREK